LKQKSKTLQAFKNFCAKVELQLIPLKLLVFNDHGGEYVLGDFFTFCIKVNITHELIQAYTLGHNGVSKQKNRTFMRRLI
jgi:hypothetical protein